MVGVAEVPVALVAAGVGGDELVVVIEQSRSGKA